MNIDTKQGNTMKTQWNNPNLKKLYIYASLTLFLPQREPKKGRYVKIHREMILVGVSIVQIPKGSTHWDIHWLVHWW